MTVGIYPAVSASHLGSASAASISLPINRPHRLASVRCAIAADAEGASETLSASAAFSSHTGAMLVSAYKEFVYNGVSL